MTTTNTTREIVLQLLREHYSLDPGCEVSLERLPGENENYLVETAPIEAPPTDAVQSKRHVLKIAAGAGFEQLFDVEERALAALRRDLPQLGLPRAVPTRSGEAFVPMPGAEGPRSARLLEFVPGRAWGELPLPSRALRAELGRLLARIALALKDVGGGAARSTHSWDLCAAGRQRPDVVLIEGADRRRLVERAFHWHAACAAPLLAQLPRGLIHGDANDENLLVGDAHDERIVGLLDFGDMLENPLVCELAIALAYALLRSEDPLREGAEVVAAYHAVRPLERAELEVLFPLVCGRLAVSVTRSAKRRRIDPEHPSWFATEGRAWDLLERLAAMDPARAGNELAGGTGLIPFPASGATREQLLVRRAARIGPALSISYRQPLKIERGAGQYLFDERGRPFLDLVNNVCHVGHCHPRVVRAGQEQLARLNTNTRYLYDGLVDYAERLGATLPAGLEVCTFLNSGSEANELALRMARAYTGREDFLVVDGAYHGHTGGLIAISPYKFMGPGGEGRPEAWVHVVPIADGYRGLHKGQGAETGRAYGDEVGRVLGGIDRSVAGFICESLLSCGGQVVAPEGYLQRAYEHVRAAGGLCIADEVQVGFARVGTHFWGFETQGVVPDIVVMGKPIGNGYPLAAVVTTREIAEAFANGMEFFATFGGNPVACAIGLAVLDVIEEEGLQERALRLGARLRDGLAGLAGQHALIGEVRGLGLFLGVELVRDRVSLEPAAEEADELVQRMRARGMLLSTDGPLHNVIKIKPPMVLSEGDVDMVVRGFDEVLRELG